MVAEAWRRKLEGHSPALHAWGSPSAGPPALLLFLQTLGTWPAHRSAVPCPAVLMRWHQADCSDLHAGASKPRRGLGVCAMGCRFKLLSLVCM